MNFPEENRRGETTKHVFWLFGLSGAGKSTLAGMLAAELRQRGRPVLALDGDIIRPGLCAGLGFSDADRTENLRRAAEVARLALASHLDVVAAFITPLEAQRQLVRGLIGAERLSLVWIDAPLQTCRTRDVKGLYASAQAGGVPQMTGLGSRFEPPGDVSLVIETSAQTVAASSERLRHFVQQRLVPPG